MKERKWGGGRKGERKVDRRKKEKRKAGREGGGKEDSVGEAVNRFYGDQETQAIPMPFLSKRLLW